MGLKGFLRSVTAVARQAEKNRQQEVKQAARDYKQLLKDQTIDNIANAVANYEKWLSLLTGLQKQCSDYIDWEDVKTQEAPEKPVKEDYNSLQILAEQALAKYKPSFLEKLFGKAKKKQAELQKNIEDAIQQDADSYNNDIEDFELSYQNWEEIQKIALNILQKNTDSYAAAINFFNPFASISNLGSKLSAQFQPNHVIVYLGVNGDDIIPNFILSQTASGKLSRKNMPVGKFNEIYQDYVCGCALRISREIYAHLPVNNVIVHASTPMLNSSTGQIEEQTILSVLIPLATIQNFNFDVIDASDSMKNFVHQMKFSKTNGFTPVENLDVNSLKL